MSRPRLHDPRIHQINLRFNAAEFARVHRNASLCGKVVPDFGRAALLRKPRPTRKNTPSLLSLPPKCITRWHAEGLALNGLAHRINAADHIDLPEVPAQIRALRALIRRLNLDAREAYRLHPTLRYHLRRVCTNLIQIADRYRALQYAPPVPLSNLINRFRIILNHDHDS